VSLSVTAITAIGRWLLPVLAAVILLNCGLALIRGNQSTGILGHLVNSANGDVMPLKSFETSIGRSNMCDIVLSYNTVSRFHAVVAKRSGKWVLYDTNSKTGTFINRVRVTDKKYLENGDTIIFGNAIFKFYEELPEGVGTSTSTYHKPEPEADSFIRNDRQQPGDVVIPALPAPGATLKTASPASSCTSTTWMRSSIGRSGDAHIRIDMPAVSRYHALLSKGAHGHWLIEDLDSTAGTLLNGIPITEPTPLADSDIIEICGYTLRFNDPYS